MVSLLPSSPPSNIRPPQIPVKCVITIGVKKENSMETIFLYTSHYFDGFQFSQ